MNVEKHWKIRKGRKSSENDINSILKYEITKIKEDNKALKWAAEIL